MAAFNKFNQFIADVYNGVHDFSSDTLKFALTTHANKPVSTNLILTDLTTVSLSNLNTNSIITVSSSQISGVYQLILDDLTVAASGNVGPFRWAVIYNDSSPNKSLIGYFDYGQDITLSTGQTFKFNFSNNLISAT